MLARALACDLTRFASLFLADLSRTQLFPELPEDIHFEVAHRYDARADSRPGTPEATGAIEPSGFPSTPPDLGSFQVRLDRATSFQTIAFQYLGRASARLAR